MIPQNEVKKEQSMEESIAVNAATSVTISQEKILNEFGHVVPPEIAPVVIFEEKSNLKTCIPPIKLNRNRYGLLENLDYKFNSEGFVDWKSMLRPQDLVLNRQKKAELEKKYQKPFNEIDIIKDKVEDKDIIILQAGIRYLAAIRGFKSCRFSWSAHEDKAVAGCTIRWASNYETSNEEVEFESTAERSKNSTVPPFSNYLISLAENAAYCRCVRNFQ